MELSALLLGKAIIWTCGSLYRDFNGAAMRRDTIDLIAILAIIAAISAWI